MKGLYTEVHDEVEIVIIDYSMVSHENQFELMKLSLDYMLAPSVAKELIGLSQEKKPCSF